MNVREIVKLHLVSLGFDGLCNGHGGCACILSDLAPDCDCLGAECKSGYRVDTPDDPDGFDYHIVENLGKWHAQKEREKREQEKPGGRCEQG